MSSITIRNMDPALKEKLRVRAAEHGHSMEAEARDILKIALDRKAPPASGAELVARIRARFEHLEGLDDTELPPRGPTRELPRFE